MCIHRALGQVESNMSTAGTAFLGFYQRQFDHVGDKIGLQQQSADLVFWRKVVGFTGESALEIIGRVENEFGFLENIQDRSQICDCNKPDLFIARPIKVLMPGIQRDGKHRPRPPFKRYFLARIVPHAGCSAPAQNQDHFFI